MGDIEAPGEKTDGRTLMLQDRSVAAIALAVAGLYIFATLSIPVLDNIDPIGPRVYPLIVAAGFVISASWLLAETIFRKEEVEPEPTSDAKEVNPNEWKVTAAVSVWMVLYFLVLVPAGFIISSSIFLLGLSSWFNRGKHVANLSTSIMFSVGMYALFTRVLEVPLPHGWLGF
jgi:putative tricarboxylic transport membrane protein